jgi:hypothetical protein
MDVPGWAVGKGAVVALQLPQPTERVHEVHQQRRELLRGDRRALGNIMVLNLELLSCHDALAEHLTDARILIRLSRTCG